MPRLRRLAPSAQAAPGLALIQGDIGSPCATGPCLPWAVPKDLWELEKTISSSSSISGHCMPAETPQVLPVQPAKRMPTLGWVFLLPLLGCLSAQWLF